MSNISPNISPNISGSQDPIVREINFQDVAESFVEGLRDFRRAPFIGSVVGAFYALGGIAIVLCVTALNVSYLAYPLAAGFALIGPFVALALYEVSRRLEKDEPISLSAIYRTLRTRSEIGWMAFVTLFIFIIWMYQVRLLIALLLGVSATFSSFREFAQVIFTTNEGLAFFFIGNIVGALLSLILFTLTVVSFPLLLEREVDFVTAMITSVRAVVKSPVPMISWAAMIVISLILSILPTFLGLIFALPILGHTTWHLYRRIVAPA